MSAPEIPVPRRPAVVGSIGQPRDGDPSACRAMLDAVRGRSAGTASRTITRGRRGASAMPVCRSASPRVCRPAPERLIQAGAVVVPATRNTDTAWTSCCDCRESSSVDAALCSTSAVFCWTAWSIWLTASPT